ncbi:hypothetical protein P8452_39773 [Trifolium repens]|nr:hypothetical protein P8452_39773 [Trifolium repens]
MCAGFRSDNITITYGQGLHNRQPPDCETVITKPLFNIRSEQEQESSQFKCFFTLTKPHYQFEHFQQNTSSCLEP